MRFAIAFLSVLSLAAFVACGGDDDSPSVQLSPAPQPSGVPGIAMTGADFEDGGVIPLAYSCDGIGKSPTVLWHDVPVDVVSLVLMAEDPDAGNFVHWLVYDIPPLEPGLTAGIGDEPTLGDGARQGKNSFDRIGYAPPCPPSGTGHTYNFFVYSLDTMVGLPAGATKAELSQAMEGHIQAFGKLSATYSRE